MMLRKKYHNELVELKGKLSLFINFAKTRRVLFVAHASTREGKA